MDQVKIDEMQSARWAQEDTLRRLASETKLSNDILLKIADNKISKDELDAIKGLRSDINRGNKATINSLLGLGRDQAKPLQSAYSNLNNSLIKSLGRLESGIAGMSPNSLVGKFTDSMGKVGAASTELGRNFTGIAGAGLRLAGSLATVSGYLIATAWPTIQDLNSGFMQLYQTGINFQTGLVGLSNASAAAGISTTELVNIFGKFGTTVTTLGTDRAVKLTKQFTELNRQSGTLGMTNAQATEAMLEYTEMLRSSGMLRNMTDDELIKGSKEFYTELNQLSAVTGRNRKELQKSVEAQLKNLDVQLLMRGLPTEIQKNIRKAVTSLQAMGPEAASAAGDFMTAFLARGGMAGLPAELINALNVSGLSDTFSMMAAKAEKGLDVTAEMDKIADRLGDPAVFQSLKQFAGLPGPVGDMARKITQLAQSTDPLRKQNEKINEAASRRLKQEGLTLETEEGRARMEKLKEEERNRFAEATKARNEKANRAQNALAAASSKLTDLWNTLIVNVLEPLLPALEGFADVISWTTEKFSALIKTTSDAIAYVLRTFGMGGKEAPKEGEAPDSAKKAGDLVAGLLALLGGGALAGVVAKLGLKILSGMVNLPFKAGAGAFGWMKEFVTAKSAKAGPLLPTAEKIAETAGTLGGGKAVEKAGTVTKAAPTLPGVEKAGTIAKTSTTPIEKAAENLGAKGTTASEAAKGLGKGMLKRVPIVGSLLAGGIEYTESGSIGKSIAAGLGTAIGGALGAAGGSLIPGPGTVAGGIAGSMAGEKAGTVIYDWLVGNKAKEDASVNSKNLAAATQNLNKTAQDISTSEKTAEPETPPIAASLSDEEISKKTLEFYEYMRNSNSNMIDLLSMMTEKLERIEESVRDQTTQVTRSVDGISNLYGR